MLAVECLDPMEVGVRSAKTWDCLSFDSNFHKRIEIAMTRTVNFTESKSQSPVCSSSRSESRANLPSLPLVPIASPCPWCVRTVLPSVLCLIAG